MTHYTASGAGRRLPLPSYNTLREAFSIDPTSKTGLVWRTGRNRGKPAGTLNAGFYVVRFDDQRLAVGRIVASLARAYVLDPSESVHYIDGDRTNNDPDNLKITTDAEELEIQTAADAFEGGLFERRVEGYTYYDLRAAGGYRMGLFNFLEVALECFKTIQTQLDADGDLHQQLSIISKRYLSEDRSRLHLVTNQY